MALSVTFRQFNTPSAGLLRRLVKDGQETEGLSLFYVATCCRRWGTVKRKSSSAKSSRSISKAVRGVIRGNVAVRSADHVKSSLHNALRCSCKIRRHALGACEEMATRDYWVSQRLWSDVIVSSQNSFHFCGVPVMYRDAVSHWVIPKHNSYKDLRCLRT